MTLQYLGTLKPTQREENLLPVAEAVPSAPDTVNLPKHLDIHLPVS